MKELTQYASLQDNDGCVEQNVNFNYYHAVNITTQDTSTTSSTNGDTSSSEAESSFLLSKAVSVGVVVLSLVLG